MQTVDGDWKYRLALLTGVFGYIKDVLQQVRDLERRLQTSKDNVEHIQRLMSSWSKTPLFERMEGKHTTLLNLSDREDRLRKRYDDVSQAGSKIHKLMQVIEFDSFIIRFAYRWNYISEPIVTILL